MSESKINKKTLVLKGAVIEGDVTIKENTSVWYNAVLRGDLAPITIGCGCNIQECSVLHVDVDCPVIVGDYVTIGHNAVLHGCEIGNNTLIGMGAIILNGAKIGNNCIVGAGALVTQGTVVPDGHLILGNPAKVKRALSDEEISKNTLNANEYIKLMKKHTGN